MFFLEFYNFFLEIFKAKGKQESYILFLNEICSSEKNWFCFNYDDVCQEKIHFLADTFLAAGFFTFGGGGAAAAFFGVAAAAATFFGFALGFGAATAAFTVFLALAFFTGFFVVAALFFFSPTGCFLVDIFGLAAVFFGLSDFDTGFFADNLNEPDAPLPLV